MQRTPLSIARPRRVSAPAVESQPDIKDVLPDAWRILDIASRWVLHADAKAGAVLAVCGIIGGTLYSVIHGSRYDHPALVHGAAIACAVLLTCATLASAIALRPRRGTASAPGSLIYFDHVGKLGPANESDYIAALSTLLHRPDQLTQQIGYQIWAVSQVAAAKYVWVNVAVTAVVAAVPTLGVTMLAAVLL